jgi:hypothetical protein
MDWTRRQLLHAGVSALATMRWAKVVQDAGISASQ